MACDRYKHALDQKGLLLFKADSHLIGHQFNASGNPKLFQIFEDQLTDDNVHHFLNSTNIYTHLGYCTYPDIPLYFVNKIGATSVWPQGGMEHNRITLKEKRVVIDQGWTFGNAVLSLSGYDIRAISESGIVQNCLFWELNFQLLQILTFEE